MEQKKRIFSGMQPSGVITLGNYLGALKNWTKLQDEYDCLYCIVDMHAITVRQDPVKLRKQARDLLVQYLAVGLDPEKNIIYYQSHVPQHAELAWILNCYTYMGELNRMTQFKDKCAKHADNINAGLFTYPSLMAADILLYDTDIVPVGNDQKQHIELTRDLAIRVNNKYGDKKTKGVDGKGNVFIVPDGRFLKEGARIMALDDPTKKMSKSAENVHSRISLLDEPSKIKKSIMKATTDSDGVVKFDAENKPGVSNLLNIYSVLAGKSVAELETMYEGKGYGDFKKDLVEVTVESLAPIKERYEAIRNSEELLTILNDGAEKADAIAQKTMQRVRAYFGLGTGY